MEHTRGNLKITIQDEGPKAVILKIEGRVVGPMVSELKRTWQELAPALTTKKLSVDLRGVVYIDSTGAQVLREIHRRTGAEFLADTPFTKHYAAQAKRGF